jgi:phage tail-like protein
VAVAADAEAGVLVAGGSTVTALPPPAGLVRAGDVLSRPLDSGRESCAWHRVELDLVRPLPLGTTVIVSTYTDDEARPAEEIEALDAGEWRAGPAGADDFLVLSGPGRYLWLKLELRGNASDTPVVRGMRVHFPRQGYLQYLPAVYQADPVSRDFLGRFLSIFETVLASVEARVEDLPRYLDPDGVPPEFLAWLAGWIDLSFERGWSTAVRRRLLRSAPDLYRRRGTAEGLRRLLKIVIGADVRLLEHYRARRWVSLGGAALGGRTELGGTCRAPRLQLEENSRIGDFSLIGPGDPRRDPFASHAHRFSVFVPGRRLRPESSARRLRALIDGAKPAHTQFEVVPVEPRFRVGVQATLGLDAVVGAYPRLVLNRCATLGHDSRLGCAAGATGPPVVRVGARRACAHALAG